MCDLKTVLGEVACDNPVHVIWKYIAVVGSGSPCVHFHGNRTNKCFRHLMINTQDRP